MPSRTIWISAAGILLFVAVCSSCSVVRAIFSPTPAVPPRPFNHLAHLDRGVSCLDCHEGADKEVKAGMPTAEFCINCHEDLDKDPAKPKEKKVAWFLDAGGKPAWSWLTRQSDEVLFSHKSHAKTTCLSCHAGIDKNVGLSTGLVQRMSSCTTCHAAAAPEKNDCATCHKSIRRDVPPPDHRQLWKKMHGACARQGGEVSTSFNCAMCHQRNSCDICHQTEAPDNHNQAWRLRSHGVMAGIDRTGCMTCHKSDSCDRCHQTTAPMSHTAGWNCPRNRHCISCHEPLQKAESCGVCHKSTPGHLTAPGKPAWHNPAMNCQSCHAATLKHPDNGDNCNSCHK